MECCCVRVPAIGKKRDRFEDADEFLSSSSPIVFSPVPASKSIVLSSPSLLPPSDPDPAGFSAGNRLSCLRCPGADSFLLFFPVGTNSQRLGFLPVPGAGEIQSLSCSGEYRIRTISVIPNSGDEFIGYVMVETMYSVDLFSVKLGPPATLCRSGVGKVFKSSAIVCSRWNPHLPGESGVLLESGELFLSDMDSGGRGVVWKKFSLPPLDPILRWVSFDFGWNPRTVIVARCDAIFVVALGPSGTTSWCLMRVEDLLDYSPVREERFVLVTRCGEEGSRFALVTERLLVLCDTREPSKPLVQWRHGIASDDPCLHVDVFGSCIVLGSLRNSRFRMFFFRPCSEAETRTVLTRMEAEFGERICGWNYGTEIPISGPREFPLSPSDWRRRAIEKESVSGFAVVERETDLREGFTLVRLLSSGNLESQRYSPAKKKKKITAGEETDPGPETRPIDFDHDEERYEFARRFLYLELNFLKAHLGSELGKALELARSRAAEKTSPGMEFHEALCEKLSSCGLGHVRSGPLDLIVFRDVGPASTLHEVVLRRMWAELPIELSLLAFVPESELRGSLFEAPPEFVAVPDLPRQLPPFVLRQPPQRGLRLHRRSRSKDSSLVGPTIPLSILLNLRGEENGFSVDSEHKLRCSEIVKIARKSAIRDSVSLADEGDELWAGSGAAKRVVLHKPESVLGSKEEEEEEVFGTLISRVSEKRDKVGGSAEMFDSLCSLKLGFDDSSSMDFGTNELKAFKLLKRQFANWQKGFDLYQDCCVSKFLT